jgi:hypothetical protein
MVNNFQVRFYENGDEAGIVDLLRLAYSNWGKKFSSIDHWKWKYLDAPLKSVVSVATSDGKIIGVNHDLSFRVKIGSSMLLSQYGADAAVHPDYRGMGVYSKIIALNDEIHDQLGIQFDCGQSINPAVNKNWVQRGHVRFPHEISYMVKIEDIDLHLKMRPLKNSILMRYSYQLVNGLNKIKKKLDSISSTDDFRVIEAPYIDDRFEDFWLIAKDEYGFCYEKDANYLTWRYCDKRAGDYVVKQAVKGNEVLGFSALRFVEDEYCEGFIMDLMALPGRVDVVDALFDDAVRHFDGLGVNVIYYMVISGNAYQKVSSKHGFVDSQKQPNIVCNVTLKKNFDLIKSLSPSQVYFSYGDTF